jgi:hypothetical protein
MTDPSHRRNFVRTLALGGAATALGRPTPAVADDEPKKDEPPKARSEVDARMDMVIARHG